MDFSVSKSELKNAVGLVRKALPKVILSEERGHLLFKFEGSKLKVSGTNNDLMAFYLLDATHSEPFSFTCDPKSFEKYMSKSETEDVSGELDPEKLILKFYTTDDKKSFLSFQSFPTQKMLTFDKSYSLPKENQKILDRNMLLKALKFTSAYLLPAKEEGRNNDYLILHEKVVYGGNGINRRGYFVSNEFSNIKNLKIRKLVVPALLSCLDKLETEKVTIFENSKIVGLEIDNKFFFGFLKSDIVPPKMPLDFLKKDGPFTRVNKNVLVKRLDRLVVANTSLGRVGIKVKLSGFKADAKISLSLLDELESTEEISCERVNDESHEEFDHIVEYKMLKEMIGVFSSGEDIDFYINKLDRAFKIYEVGKVEEEKYIAVGAGSYARVVG